MTRRTSTTLAVAMATALLLAACQAGSGSPSPAASVPAASAPSSEEPVESASTEPMAHTAEVATSASLDDYITDAEGRTLYIFLNDSPGETTCFDACLQSWPAYTVDSGTSPTAGDGITGALGTIERDDGSTQVTLEGWPLYYFAADGGPGDTRGQGVGDVWFVARPDGSVPSAEAASQSDYTY